MELFNPGLTKQECVDSCPTYGRCKEIGLRGLFTRVQASAILQPTGADFVDEITGEPLTEAQYFGVDGMSNEAAGMLYDGGGLIEKSARTYRDLLAEGGCTGPREIGEGVSVCTGDISVRIAIDETYEDVFYRRDN